MLESLLIALVIVVAAHLAVDRDFSKEVKIAAVAILAILILVYVIVRIL